MVLNYISKDAPIIIHFNCARLIEIFLKDTNYRNLFEIHKGSHFGGHGGRFSWNQIYLIKFMINLKLLIELNMVF